MKKIFLILLLFLPAYFCGQEKKHIFGSSFYYSSLNSEETEGKSVIYDIYSFFPIYRSDKSSFGGKLEYRNEHISGINEYFNQSLSALNLNVIWNNKINKSDKLTCFTTIGIHSDFKDISGDDFIYKLGGMYFFRINNRFSAGLGLVYSRHFFGNRITPLIRFQYQFSPKFYISGVLPMKPAITYKFNNRVSLTAAVSGKLESYRLSKKEFDNSYIVSSGWLGLTKLNFALKKHHVFNISMGGFINRPLKYYEYSSYSDWKIFNFDVTKKNKPIQEIKSSGLNFAIVYNYEL